MIYLLLDVFIVVHPLVLIRTPVNCGFLLFLYIHLHMHHLICGDFNYPNVDWDNHSQSVGTYQCICSAISGYSFEQFILDSACCGTH